MQHSPFSPRVEQDRVRSGKRSHISGCITSTDFRLGHVARYRLATATAPAAAVHSRLRRQRYKYNIAFMPGSKFE